MSHGWTVGKIVINPTPDGTGGQFRFVPRCECGWEGPDCRSDAGAAEMALAHVRHADGRDRSVLPIR